jgi:hypothetical protein
MPQNQNSPALDVVNELISSSLELRPMPGVEIKDEENPVRLEKRPATKRSIRKSLEDVEAPAKKRKQPTASSSPAAAPPKENAGLVDIFIFQVARKVFCNLHARI